VKVFADVADVKPYIAEAAIYVAPLRIGSGVKVKIMEAMALGKAIVATAVAAEGMGLVSGRDLEVAELDAPFCDAVVRLFSEPQRRSSLEANARSAAVKLFSVEAGVKTLDAAYAGLGSISRST
jgi:glycosyltransferase involved in cell wall biosynthesis